MIEYRQEEKNNKMISSYSSFFWLIFFFLFFFLSLSSHHLFTNYSGTDRDKELLTVVKSIRDEVVIGHTSYTSCIRNTSVFTLSVSSKKKPLVRINVKMTRKKRRANGWIKNIMILNIITWFVKSLSISSQLIKKSQIVICLLWSNYI